MKDINNIEEIESLAEQFFEGKTSEDIEFLVKSKNKIFQEHLDFLKEVRSAFNQIERLRIKKNISTIDKTTGPELKHAEIRDAIKLTERNKLKERLRKPANDFSGGQSKRFQHW